MALNMRLKQLRNADVRFISLVDRAATRIPFRVLKRDKESKMGIDLTSVFKSESSVRPHISSLVVFAQKDEAAGKSIADAIGKYGFKTDKVQKADEGATLVYAQGVPSKDTQIVRLSDQTLVAVAGLAVPEGWVGDMVEEHGFFPDIKLATSTLYDHLQDIVAKSEQPQDDMQAALTSYAEYLTQIAVLPANVFKLDEAVAEIVAKCSCEGKDAVSKEETEEERCKRIKDHPPSEMAPADEEDDQKPPPDSDFVTGHKAEAILASLKTIGETMTGLATKLEGVVTEQTAQKKVLDEVVQKSDALSTTLRTTVQAAPVSEDRPGPARMRVQKEDDDPRKGNFDTAFIRRNRSR